MKTTPTHYETLNIKSAATAYEIRAAYRGLAKIHHPDVGGNKEDFQTIRNAYEVLSDVNKRREYDHQIGLNVHDRSIYYSYHDHTSTATDPGSGTAGYDHLSGEYQRHVFYLVEKVKSHFEVQETIELILPLMRTIQSKMRNENDYLDFSSKIAESLIDVVMRDALSYIEDFQNILVNNNKRFRMAYQSMLLIDLLSMNVETKTEYLNNKSQLDATLADLPSSLRDNFTKLLALGLLLLFVYNTASLFGFSFYISISLVLLSNYFYKSFYFSIYLLLSYFRKKS